MQCEILNPAEYGAWDDLVHRSPHGTVFHYSWWLNIAAQKFNILVVRDKHGAMCGGVPLPLKRRGGLKLFHAPQLTPFLGPIFDIEGIKEPCDQLFLMRSAGELMAHDMPRFDSFRCMVGARGPDLQGFLWSGFRAELAYTFRMMAGTSVEQVEAHVTRTHLQKLSKAKRLGVSVTKNDDLDAFAKLCKIGSVHGNRTLHPDELPIRLWSAALKRRASDFYLARASSNQPIAALLTVHDTRTTYQIVSALDSSQREIPGSYVLLWTALQEALAAKRDFDFEGSALRGVEQYYRRWGPVAVPVWRLEKAGSFRGGLLQSAASDRQLTATTVPNT
ncbi:MAG TPA: GNAT family N-acetyltransferase [Candidatus Dormibacteraeota bacterium]|nr:GNAT family N-acetyltransferase [Candidatus Dormibacteraeota bacterium]